MSLHRSTASQKFQLGLAGAGLFLAGGAAGYYLPASPKHGGEYLAQRDEYAYVNPLLFCGDVTNVQLSEVQKAQDRVNDFVNLERSRGRATDIAVYYRDLTNSSRFDIDADAVFSPGSLLKVPLMMSLLKKAEADPGFLDQPIRYSHQAEVLPQEIVAPSALENGRTYPIRDLMREMITKSDNYAATLLYERLGPEEVNATYLDLDLPAVNPSADYSISVSDYSSFLRVLFNATYLSPELSEEALELMIESEFKDGIVAGIPSGIPVAHKFGEREVGAVSQLHDCGIVYVPNQPYILCVMTRGSDIAQLEDIIENVSRIVYDAVVK